MIRDDDREEVVRERLAQYERQTRPLIEFFRATSDRLIEVDASGKEAGSGIPAHQADSASSSAAGSGPGMIIRKTRAELEKMRRSGLLVHKILHALGAMVEEGISTWDLELAAVKMMADAGAKPAFKDYFVQAAG